MLSSAIYIVLLTLTSLALSAYVRWKTLARASLFILFVVTEGFANVINLIMHTKWGSLLSVRAMIRVVWRWLFGLSTTGGVPVAAAWLSLIAMCGFSIWLLARKVRAYEVVR